MHILISIVLLALALNFAMVTIMFYLDEQEIIEWNMIYTIPIGVTNGLVIVIYQIKREKQKEIDHLR